MGTSVSTPEDDQNNGNMNSSGDSRPMAGSPKHQKEHHHHRHHKHRKHSDKHKHQEGKHQANQRDASSKKDVNNQKEKWRKHVVSTEQSSATKSYMKRLFKNLDKDNDGYISFEDVAKALKAIGHVTSEKDVNEIAFEHKIPQKNGAVDISSFFIIAGYISPDTGAELLELKEVFKNLDKDKDGFISERDLKNAVVNGQRFTEAEIRDLIELTDTDGDGKISFSEFSNMIGK